MKVLRSVLGLLLTATVLIVLPASSAQAAHCNASDEWSAGGLDFTIKGVWTCDANQYKWFIRTYVQTKDLLSGWHNVSGLTSTNLKYQTNFIKDTRGKTSCVPPPTPPALTQYRVVIDYAHVWNQAGVLLTAYSTEGWVGPGHPDECVVP
jgi:hypothetical protein